MLSNSVMNQRQSQLLLCNCMQIGQFPCQCWTPDMHSTTACTALTTTNQQSCMVDKGDSADWLGVCLQAWALPSLSEASSSSLPASSSDSSPSLPLPLLRASCPSSVLSLERAAACQTHC